jgi:flagellar motor switch protein FliN/FliY
MDGAIMSQDAAVSVPPDAIGVRSLPVFRELPPHTSQSACDLEQLRDVELDVRIELGRARMRLADVLNLADGAVVELDRSAGDPVDIFVNDRLVARGEVVVLNDHFAVRLTQVVSPMHEGQQQE